MAIDTNTNMTREVELETFLPKNKNPVVVPQNNIADLEVTERLTDPHKFDPLKDRVVKNPTSDFETLTHLLKSSLGTGILSMPFAFKSAGLYLGVICMLLVSVVCTHCCFILVKVAHILYYKTGVTQMSFADVGEKAFETSSFGFYQKLSKYLRVFIQVGLFSAYFGAISVYTVIIGANIQQVVEHYFNFEVDARVYIVSLLPALILLSWVRNLKALAPVSMVANLLMALCLGITAYYLVQDLPCADTVSKVGPFTELPMFFCISIFAIEAIGAVMPLENSMKHPRHFLGMTGVLNQGMGGVTVLYMIIGFLGYLKFGEHTQPVITLNLPAEDFMAQSVKVLVALAVFLTFGLQYYVCFDILWSSMKERYTKNTRVTEYVVRTILATAAVLLAVAVPDIRPFVGLIGSFFFSLLGLIIPVFIESAVFSNSDTEGKSWMYFRHGCIFIFGAMALIFGTHQSILDVIAVYVPTSGVNTTDVIIHTTIAAANITPPT